MDTPRPQAMERRSAFGLAFTAAAAIASASGCTDRPTDIGLTAPPTALAVKSVTADPHLADAADVSFLPASADSVRVHYMSTDGSDTGLTPWFPGGPAAVTLLGLRAATSYTIALEARRGGASVTGGGTLYTTPPLPQALTAMNLTRVSGTPTMAGYTLSALPGPDGHGYLVAFDGSGSIRWYRDFGPTGVQEAKQQTNGDFTVFVGNSHGDDAVFGAYVEVKPTGDSVRSITAKGSAYTDGHELVVTSDANGNRTADYLFGYDIRSVDQSAFGGGSNDKLAGHQILRINTAGSADTLMQGWTYWTHADKIDVPTQIQDIDHPNSIDFDRDGGMIVSFRDLGAILKIDPVTHQVLWQLGGTRNQFTFIGDPLNGFSGQHSVRVLINAHFLVFDNGVNHSIQASRVVEYAVNEAAKTATMVWQYTPNPSLFNPFTGSVQRLSNGNTVIAWTTFGLIDEVAPDGSLVSRVQLNSAVAVQGVAYRAIRIDNLYQYTRP